MNEIEEKFFKTFGIEPKELEYPDNFEYYPEITDRILLELICIYNNYANINGGYPMMVLGLNRNAIKESLLARFINYKEELKNQVQSLFECGVE